MDLQGNLKRWCEEIEREKEQFKFYTQMLHCYKKKIASISSSSVWFKQPGVTHLNVIYLQAQ